MKNGTYKTKAGSIVTVSGMHNGSFDVEFDWLEEGGCIECIHHVDHLEEALVWDCEYCEGGSAKLYRQEGGT